MGCTPRVHGASDSERHKAAIIQLAVDCQAAHGGSVGLPASPRPPPRRLVSSSSAMCAAARPPPSVAA